jgi:hypothetical protein
LKTATEPEIDNSRMAAPGYSVATREVYTLAEIDVFRLQMPSRFDISDRLLAPP